MAELGCHWHAGGTKCNMGLSAHRTDATLKWEQCNMLRFPHLNGDRDLQVKYP